MPNIPLSQAGPAAGGASITQVAHSNTARTCHSVTSNHAIATPSNVQPVAEASYTKQEETNS